MVADAERRVKDKGVKESPAALAGAIPVAPNPYREHLDQALARMASKRVTLSPGKR